MRRRLLLLLRGVWLGLLVWPYALTGDLRRPWALALLPPLLGLAESLPALPATIVQALIALAAGALTALPAFTPRAIVHAMAVGGPRALATSITGALLWLTALLGWQVFRDAGSRGRLVWLWLMGTLVLALNRRFWGIVADAPTLGFVTLGLLLLGLGEDAAPNAPGITLASLLPLLGALTYLVWPAQAPPPLARGGTPSLGLAGLRIAVTSGSLPQRVDINRPVSLSPTPLLTVQGGSHPAYWQEAIYDRFDGSDWHETPGPRLPLPLGVRGTPLLAPASQGLPTQTWRVTVQELLPGSVAPLVYAGTPQALLSAAAAGAGYILPSARALYLPGAGIYRLQLAIPVLPSPAALGRLPFAPADVAPAVDLLVPAGLRQELTPLARSLARGASDPWQLAQRITTYLDSHEVYDPNFSPSQRGDPVGRFLLRTHRGYCDQFSTAFVILARLDHLPARWAVGFAPGPYDAQRRVETLRAQDAHSWAEIYVAPYGWLPVDPTPGAALSPLPPGRRLPAAAVPRTHAAPSGLPWLAISAAALAALLGFFAARGRRGDRTSRRLRRLERRLERLAQAQDLPKRPTLRERARSLPPAERKVAWPALEVLEAARYGPKPPDAADLQRAEAALEQTLALRRAERRKKATP